jgi:peroxiredoxin
MAEVGDLAPDFTLKDQDGNDVTLSALRGKKVILSFHPLAWTEVCKIQMQDLEKHREKFAELNAIALGISVDSVPLQEGLG